MLLTEVDSIKIGSVNLTRLVDEELGFSILAPDEWAVGSTEEFDMVFIGPAVKGLHVNLGIAISELVRGNRMTINILAEQVQEFLSENYPKLEIVEERPVEIEGGRPGLIRAFSWTDSESGLDVMQILLMAAGKTRLYDLTATLAKEAASEYRPVIDAMLNSLKFSTARPASLPLPTTGSALELIYGQA